MPKSVSKPGLSVTVTQALIHRKTLSLPHTLPQFFCQNCWLFLSCFVINWFPLFVCVLSHLVVSDSSVTPWTVAHQASLFFSLSWSLLQLMSVELMMQSNHLILCCPLLILLSIFPRIRVFFNESALCIR